MASVVEKDRCAQLISGGLWLHPRVLETLSCSGSFVRVEGQHGQEEVGKGTGRAQVPLVFFSQNLVQPPGLQFSYVLQFSLLVEEVSRVLALESCIFGNFSEQLDNVRQVVLIS